MTEENAKANGDRPHELTVEGAKEAAPPRGMTRTSRHVCHEKPTRALQEAPSKREDAPTGPAGVS